MRILVSIHEVGFSNYDEFVEFSAFLGQTRKKNKKNRVLGK